MQHPLAQSWGDSDRLLAAYLERDPHSSSIELVNNLAAETGPHWPEARRIVGDYLFRNTSQADWKQLRPQLMFCLRVFFIMVATVGVGGIAAHFLSPLMVALVRQVGAVFAVTVLWFTITPKGSTARNEDLRDRRSGEKRVESL